MPEPSTPSEPQKADAPSAGDLDPATQIVVDAQNTMGTAPSAGDTSTEPTTPADDTGQQDDGTQQPDDQGKDKRLEQINSAQRQTLIALGVNPDSEAVKQFNEGLITKEELLGTATQAVEQPKSAVDQFNEHRNNMKELMEKGKAPTAADFLKSMDLTSAVMQENSQKEERGKREVLIDNCINAAGSVITNDPLHKSLPEDIQEIETQFFVASTDSVWGVATGGDQSKVTPANYDYYAKQNLQGPYQKLRNALIEHGRQLERGTPPEPPPTPTVNPISTNIGSGPVTPAEPKVNLDNMQKAAREYAKKQRAAV